LISLTGRERGGNVHVDGKREFRTSKGQRLSRMRSHHRVQIDESGV